MITTKRTLFVSVISALLICVTLGMCSCFLFKHIEDTNGADDYSLCTITEERICSGATSSVEFGAVSTSFGSETKYSVQKMSGVKVLSKTNADPANTYVCTITSSVTSGNLRVCFVNKGKIVYDVEINKTVHVELSNLSGTLELRVAGESAAFSITVS